MVGKRGVVKKPRVVTYLRKDVEEGRPAQDRKYRFRDQKNLDPDDRKRVEFKKLLLDGPDGVDGNGRERGMEAYRRSDEEVCSFDASGSILGSLKQNTKIPSRAIANLVPWRIIS
jgi:hypothetical protein